MAGLLIFVQNVEAIPADPRLRSFVQNSGDTLNYRVIGDEHAHMAVTLDGFPLKFNKIKKCFEYAKMDKNVLSSTGIIAANGNRRSVQDVSFLNKIGAKETARSFFSQRGIAHKLFKKINNYPTTGSRHSLVLLVEFKDKSFTSVDNPQQFYKRMLNETGFSDYGGTGSVSQYYRENSHGLFDVQYDVVGPIQLDKPYRYYGESDDSCVVAFMDACKKADSLGIVDFKKYDCNKDGEVDNIFFFFAGYGEADSGDESTIWPNSWSLDEAGRTLSLQGMKINSYACSNEIRYNKNTSTLIPTGVGTFIHEFGHVLGFPDLYDTSYNYLAYGIETWDLMASGSYNNDMCTPPNLSAFEKWTLDWEEPAELTLGADSVINLTKTIDGKSLMITGPASNEYFFIENRQGAGWDYYLPGHGMLVWHVDLDSAKYMTNTVNNDASHQCIDIVEASAIGKHSYDPYPGADKVVKTKLYSWNGDLIDEQPAFITEKDSLISFALAGVKIKMGHLDSLNVDSITDNSFRISWNKIDKASQYIVNINYKDKSGDIHDVMDDFATNATSLNIDSLLPDTKYNVAVYGLVCDSRSDTVTASVKTDELYFYKRMVSVLDATDVGMNGFTANWQPLKDADSYAVTLNTLAYGDNTNDEYYDFSGDELPDLWQSSSSSYSAVSGFYGASAPSLRLSKDGDYLTIGYPESLIYKLKFWYRSAKASGKIYIEKNVAGSWVVLDSISSPSVTGTEVGYDIDGSSAVRIRYSRVFGYIAIDDVTATVKSIVRTPVAGYCDYNVGNVHSFSFDKLSSSTNYGYTVKAMNGAVSTSASDEIRVSTLVPADVKIVGEGGCAVRSFMNQIIIFNTTGTAHHAEIFDANGCICRTLTLGANETASCVMTKGLYLVKIGDVITKVFIY